MNFIESIFRHIVDFFHKPTVKKVEEEIATIMPIALTFVKEFDSFLPPSGQIAVETIIAFANKYVIPINTAALTSDDALKNAAQNLVRDAVRGALPDNLATIANNVINAAVTAVVALYHAKEAQA